ncbi:hypothetical protein JG687_00002081, partial [Phytophthora cactorum]
IFVFPCDTNISLQKVSLLDGMALPRAKKRSATVFSRDEIGVEQLQSLKEKFADGDLTEKEFVSLFREIVDASLSETQLTELFQKIDANSDGTVDWDELTNYMFLSGSGSDEYTGDDGNSCYETAYPEKYTGDTGSGNGSGGTGLAIPTDIMGNVTGGSGGSLGLGLLPHHKDVITRIVRLERPSVYLTTSKDGSIRTWSANTLAPQQVLASGRDWLTDCCVMKRSNRLAVSSMNRTLSFYDLNSGQLIGDLVDYSRRQCIPLCLAYVERPSDDREAVVVGDDTGGISIFTCSDQWLTCDGRSPPPGSTATSNSGNASSNGTSGGNPSTVNSSGPVAPSGSSTGSGAGNTSQTAATPTSTISGNPAGSAMLEAQGFSSRVKFQKHTDWITRVKWVNDMRAVVATSLDATVSILDVDRLVVKFEYTRHRKGVFDLAWCASTRLIASCGMERDIHIWNPYSSQRAVATLKGHTSSVLHLVSDDENFQIVSAAADNTVKVWDVRNHRCLQTFIVDRHRGGNATTAGTSGAAAAASMYAGASGANLSAESRVSALLFDGKKPCLMTATTQLTRWTVKSTDSSGLQGGDDVDESPDVSLSVARKVKLRGGAPVERPVRLACYNSVFHQVVTAAMDAESAIKTWSAETGEEISSFAHPHGSNPVTSIAFDHAGRRLLTGSHDGEQLKMWNFSNGALVKQFHKKEPPVVSSLLFTATSATAGTVASTAPLPDDPSGEAAATVNEDSAKDDTIANALQPPTSVFIKNCAISVLNSSISEPPQNAAKKQEDFDDDDGSMRIGRKSLALSTVGNAAILSRRSSPFGPSSNNCEPRSLATTSYLKRKIADVNGELTDLITIVKVTRGEIFYWDSATNKPLSALKVLGMSDFVRKAGWTKHSLLSHFIGRTFLDGETCFRVAAIVMRSLDPTKPDKKSYALIDSEAKEHALQPLNEAVSSARFKVFESSRNERSQQNTASSSPHRRTVASPVIGNSTMGIPQLQTTMQTLSVSNQALNELIAGSTASPPSSRGSTPEALALASSVGMGARTLPLIRPREKRVMGGLLPKRSSVRNRMDPAADIRRIHNPDDIPKNFRAMLQRKRDNKDSSFEGILPES